MDEATYEELARVWSRSLDYCWSTHRAARKALAGTSCAARSKSWNRMTQTALLQI